MPLDFSQDCRCQACLSKAVDNQLDVLIKDNGIEHVLRMAEPYRTNDDAVEYLEHLDFVVEDGLYIFTKWQHVKRGECCGNGCQNCPYWFFVIFLSEEKLTW